MKTYSLIDDLRAVRDLLQGRGRTKQRLEDEEGRICLTRAIDIVAAGDWRRNLDIERQLLAANGNKHWPGQLWRFNDTNDDQAVFDLIDRALAE